MKFIVDAQLPKRLSSWIQDQGFDCLHTLDLPEQNLTQDTVIIQIAENKVVELGNQSIIMHF